MSAQLSNKVNQLCQKVKNLSKHEATSEDKAYLFAKVDFGTNDQISVLGTDNIPSDTILRSNGITLNSSGGAVISLDGTYSISFLTHNDISNVNNPTFIVAVNDNLQDGTSTTNYNSELSSSNTVILNLIKGDVVTIVNNTFTNKGGIATITLVHKYFNNTMDTNLSIHKI